MRLRSRTRLRNWSVYPIMQQSRSKPTLLILLATFFIASSVSSIAIADGRSFYVDPAGSDSNSGTSTASPWRSIAKVNALTFGPGDKIYFKRGGLWRETIQPGRGGSAGNPVLFTAYGNGPQPIVDGSDVITGWTRGAGSTYVARSSKPGNVFVDGKPGWGFLHACCPPGSRCAPSGSCAIGQMEPGSWMWDSATSMLAIWMPDGSDPSSHMVEAATRPWGMNVVGSRGEKSNIIVDGLMFERTGGGGLYFFSNGEGGVGFTGIVVRNCTVTQVGTGHIDDGSYYNGIHYGQHVELPTAPIFEHNRVSFTGNHGNGINTQYADNAQLLYNDVSEFNHSGLDMKHSRGVLVRGNVVHDSYNTNAIYQEYCGDSLIENNLVYNVPGEFAGRGSGIQIDLLTSGDRVFNNSIFNVYTGIYLNMPATIQYNAVANATFASIEANAGGDISNNVWGTAPIIVGHQRFDLQGWNLAGHADTVATAPMWSNPGRGDFTVLPSSPLSASHAGVTIPINAGPK